jgi:hypothetical protein
MRKFLEDRKHLIGKWGIEYVDSNKLRYLKIRDFPILAGFTGYLKFQCRKRDGKAKVFYRGQNKDFDLTPSLFRDYDDIEIDNKRIANRLKAYKELLEKTSVLYKARRFKNENLNPILQHYGIRTPWIDLVDNIFVAIWFAINKFEENSNGILECKPSSEKHGWIYYFQVNDDIEYYDLRERHSSLSLRLHSQHGISATRKDSDWNIHNRNLDEYVCARVKFPITDDWLLRGRIFNPAFMFPGEKFDNTYKYLRRKKFSRFSTLKNICWL